MPSATRPSLPPVERIAARITSEISAMMPPSPSLFARITSTMYLSVTMIISAQNTSDSTP